MLGQPAASVLAGFLCSLAVVAFADEQKEYAGNSYDQEAAPYDEALEELQRPAASVSEGWASLPEKRDLESSMPGVLRFGKRAQSFIRFGRADGEMQKKEMPGVLRFGKRSQQEKKSVPGVLRFGKRSDMPGVLRFGKRNDIPGVLRFGKKSVPGVLRFGRK